MRRPFGDRPWLVDVAVVALLLSGGTVLGTAYVGAFERAGNRGQFYQVEFAPAALFACGRGLSNPASSTPALVAFLEERQATFTCDDLPARVGRQPLRPFQARERYLLLLAGLTWRIRGISWQALHGLAGAMFGVSLALGYLVFRLGMGRTLAAIMTLLWGCSFLQLIHLPQLRDYSKLPFFLAAVLVAGRLVLVRHRPAIVLMLMAGLGAVLGLGFGIRTDVTAFLIMALAALLLFREKPTASDIALRLGGCALAVLAFIAVALPVLRSHLEASPVWHVALLGLTDASDDWLQLNRSLYGFGYAYNDSFVSTTVVAYWARVHPSLAALHPSDAVEYGSKTYEVAARWWYQLLARNFPADFITRAWAAVCQVLEWPFAEPLLGAPSGVPDYLARTFYVGRASFLRLWGGGLPVVLFFVSGCLMAVRHRRGAIFFVCSVAFLAGLTALQFQRRHAFHLEIVSFWVLGWLITVVGRWLKSRVLSAGNETQHGSTRWSVALVFAIAFLVVIVAPLGVLRSYQDARVDDLLNRYSAAATSPLPLTGELSPDRRSIVIPVSFQSLERDPSRQVFTEMVVGEFSGTRCDYEYVDVTFQYAAQDPRFDFSRRLRVPIPAADDAPLRIYEPLYQMGHASKYSKNFSFSGIALPAHKRDCLTRLSRFSEPDRYPLLLEATVPADWPRQTKHETIAGWERSGTAHSVHTYATRTDFEVPRSVLRRPVTRINGRPSYRHRIAALHPDGSVSVSGAADGPATYLVTWAPGDVAPGRFLFAEGDLYRGGFALGLVKNGRWVSHIDVTQTGPFRVMIQVEPGPDYEITLANNLGGGGRRNSFEIARLGWLP